MSDDLPVDEVTSEVESPTAEPVEAPVAERAEPPAMAAPAMAAPPMGDTRLMALPEDQRGFANTTLESGFAAKAQSYGFDPISLITLILPIAMEILKTCAGTEDARINQIRKKTVFAKIAMRRAVQRAQIQYRATYGGKSNVGVNDLSQSVLDTASAMSVEELRAAF